ncbi:MAG: hypothetical protein AB6733_16595 [Clostridiaceae bacterium]
MKKIVLGVIASLIVVIAIGYIYYDKNRTIETVAVSKDESSQTKVYGVLNVPMEKNNMIWCGTFQLAWNELKDNMIKQDIKIKDENKLSTELNKKAFTKDYLSEKDYIAMVGYNKDGIVEKINTTLKEKFNEGDKWKVETVLTSPDDILAYSFLKKNVEFETAFEKIEDGLDFSGSKVKAFGIDKTLDAELKDKLMGQVKILNYVNDDNFIVSLKGKSENDEIILAKIPEKDTFENTLNYALTNSNDEISFEDADTLKVPMLDFDINKRFTELENKKVENKGFEDYTISSAIQRIEFTLTEKGAELKSKAEMGLMKSAMPSNEPKNLILDKPFLLYMKEKGDKKPYFAIWVNNSDLMIK